MKKFFLSRVFASLESFVGCGELANRIIRDRCGSITTSCMMADSTSLESKHEVAIMYFGRASEFLLMTSERLVIPSETYTLGQVLDKLRERGGRWAYELDDNHVACTINGKAVRPSDTITAGVEISIFSSKSIFER